MSDAGTSLQAEALLEGDVLGFLRALWLTDHGLQLASRRMQAEHGITGPQRLAIRLIGGQRGGLTGSELARLLHLDPSTTSGIVSRLTEAGLVRQANDRKDRRRRLLTLTTKGRALERLRRGTVEGAVAEALKAVPAADLHIAERTLALLGTRLTGAPRSRRKKA